MPPGQLPALAAAGALTAAAAPPTFSYFDPPLAPAGATVTLVGENLGGATSMSLIDPGLIDSAVDWPFVQVSDEAISFVMPAGFSPSFHQIMSAWVVTPDGLAVVVPEEAPVAATSFWRLATYGGDVIRAYHEPGAEVTYCSTTSTGPARSTPAT